MSDSDRATIVSSFLQDPRDRKRFGALFGLSLNLTRAFLNKLKSLGWRLPVYDNDDERSISDLAIDILIELFKSKSQRPFYIIYDFYSRQGIRDFDKDIDEIYDQFRILLWSSTRQTLYRLSSQENPQIANLKRRIKDILKGDEYSFYGNDKKSVYLSGNEISLQSDKPLIPKDNLVNIVETAYLRSKTRSGWCRKIFNLLGEQSEYCGILDIAVLIDTIVSVNARHVELDGNYSANLPTPQTSLQQTIIKKATVRALDTVKSNHISHFLEKGKMTEEESKYFYEAVEKYLLDKGSDGTTDLIPEYFREVTPGTLHKAYLKKYKYIFETIINKADEYFVNYLKNNL